MKEYDVSFFAADNGGFGLDIHCSTGTSPYATFRSRHDLQDFFASQGIHDERLAEIDSICSQLVSGQVYHARMFLPDSVIEAQEKLITGAQRSLQPA